MPRKLLILTEGFSEPIRAKTATSVIRYGKDQTVALLDSTQVGKTSQQLLGVGGEIPVVGRLADAAEADTLLIGIAPTGGKLPDQWRPLMREALERGMNIVSGLHDFLSDDPELADLAAQKGATIHDVRKNDEHDVAHRKNIREECLRIQTVGNDCCVGKKVVAIEIARELQRRDIDAKFVATGQSGIMIEGDGCPVDTVVSDFLNGAVEKQVLANQQHDVIVVEGQGSLAHPRYSAVTLGLLHGAAPHGLILCYEADRPHVHGMDYVPLVPLVKLRDIYETMAGLMQPAKVIAVAMNGRRRNPEQAEIEKERVRSELGLPVCDPYRDGPEELANAVLKLRQELGLT